MLGGLLDQFNFATRLIKILLHQYNRVICNTSLCLCLRQHSNGVQILNEIYRFFLRNIYLQKERLNYVRTGSGAHTVLYFMELGTLFVKINWVGRKGKKSANLVPRLRMLGFITQFLHTPAWYVTEFSTGFTVQHIYRSKMNFKLNWLWKPYLTSEPSVVSGIRYFFIL